MAVAGLSKQLEADGEILHLPIRTGLDGKKHPAAAKECAGNNFPVFPNTLSALARSQTGRRAAWTPMHRNSNGR